MKKTYGNACQMICRNPGLRSNVPCVRRAQNVCKMMEETLSISCKQKNNIQYT